MSRLEVSELSSGDLGRYEALNRTSPHGSVWTSASWADYNSTPYVPYGAFRGSELIGGTLLPVSNGQVLSNVQGTPWMGLIARSQAESESLEIAGRMAEVLGARYGEVALTLPPEWSDVRGFLWQGWRAHVRYTYRGYIPHIPNYERRLRLGLRSCEIKHELIEQRGDWDSVPMDPLWRITRAETGDSNIHVIEDEHYRYLWQANRGGKWHTELIDDMLKYGHPYLHWGQADLVGCNSPQRALFKRAFGLPLVPYYYVTTGDPADVKEFWGERRPLAA